MSLCVRVDEVEGSVAGDLLEVAVACDGSVPMCRVIVCDSGDVKGVSVTVSVLSDEVECVFEFECSVTCNCVSNCVGILSADSGCYDEVGLTSCELSESVCWSHGDDDPCISCVW